jgi:hypothetical protein
MTEPFRVIVTGARATFPDQDALVRHVLQRATGDARTAGRLVIVVEGECPHDRTKCDAGPDCPHRSVDLAARRWALFEPGVAVDPHPADWRRHGRAAGGIRNGEMVRPGGDLCLAFPGHSSVGTWDCLRQAARRGIVGRVYPLGETPHTATRRP